jgi:tyrocidine synthetase-3
MSSANLQFLDERLKKEKDYWLQKLLGDLVVTGIPLDFRRPGVFTDEREVVNIRIEPETGRRLLKVCGNKETLAFTVLVTALKVCLYKYTGVEDIIVGTTIHQRYREVVSLNKVLALRNQLSGAMTVRQLLEQVRQTLSDAYAHQKYPFDRILHLLGIEPPNNRAPLFNVVVMLENIHDRENIKRLKNDVTLAFSITNGDISGTIEYHPGLFHKRTIETLGTHYKGILQAVLDCPDAQISELEILSAEKKHELVFDFNATDCDYPKQKTIHQLFEEQVARTPLNIAAVFDHHHLTYSELNRRANQLAHRLRRFGVGPGERVGIYLEHSLEMVVGLLGILKAGGAYVPLDPAHPEARLAFILADAQISVIVTHERLAERPLADEAQMISLDSDWELVSPESEENPTAGATAQDLAYVIYTSGSTGQPKGVKIQHAALINYIWWAKDVYLQNERLAFPLYSSLAFDLTVTSIFTPLITGNTVIVYRREGKESPLAEILRDNQVGVLKLTPSHLLLLTDGDNRQCHIKRLIVGGEMLESELARRVYESFGGEIEIFNEYGPTEATVGCMIHKFDPVADTRNLVPIGRPAANVQIYILDDRLHPVAENVMGELFISGDGLATGYLNRSELTAERFVDNPFIPGQKMYKTGDVARWLPEGIIEFVGRTDDQVKFYGYRVELNEVRCALNRHPQIRDSVVVVTKDRNGHDVMIAYYVSRQEIAIAQLRAFLSERLVEETIPNVFVHLKKLPLTLNGKINVSALPTLDEARQKLARTFVAPQTPTEEVLARIWTHVLGLQQISINDNFFELGGHSLLATQVISRVRQLFKVDLPVRSLFEAPTLAELAQVLIAHAPNVGQIEKTAQILKKIEGLSDRDVSSELGNRKKERKEVVYAG